MADGPASRVAPASPPITPLIAGLFAAGLLAGLLGVSLALAPRIFGPERPELAIVRVAGLVIGLAGIALVTSGLGGMVFGPVWRSPVAARAGFGTHRVMLSTTLFATLLAALVGNLVPLLVLATTGRHDLRNAPGFLSTAISVSLVLVAVGYFRFVQPGAVFLADFGWSRNRWSEYCLGQVWLAHLVTGVGGGLVVLLLSGSVQALLNQAGVKQTQLNDFVWIRSLSPISFGLLVLAGAVLAPLSEEFFFRGIVFRGYLDRQGPRTAYLISAVVFATLHLNLPAFLPILVLGLLLAWLYRSTGSLLPCVVAHGVNNGVAFFVLYLAPQALGRQ